MLIPSYLMAYFNDKMVYVVPTLAAGLIVANVIGRGETQKKRVDENGDNEDDGTTFGDSGGE